MLRNLGGAVGIAMVQTFVTNREKFHSAIINPSVSLLNPATQARIDALQAYFMAHGMTDPAGAREQAIQLVGRIIQPQSYYFAYGDAFAMLGCAMLGALICTFSSPPQRARGAGRTLSGFRRANAHQRAAAEFDRSRIDQNHGPAVDFVLKTCSDSGHAAVPALMFDRTYPRKSLCLMSCVNLEETKMSRVALVTGGTRGIGAAISIALKKAGRTVVASYAGNTAAAEAFHKANRHRGHQIRRRQLRGMRRGRERYRRTSRARSKSSSTMPASPETP